MNIALLAHDEKKELMVQFCIAYCGILAGHSLCSTSNMGTLIAEATGLNLKMYLNSAQGGSQQIGARIAYDEIDLVIFLCGASGNESCDDVNEIARLCDRSTIPFASNIATAEVLIQGLKRGDFDWRDIINPKN
ncbi:MAG: methylglyoxal synthase [Oscillospiraceae bacterium]|nr:methylglyoxal synthase [Oscillospiraceae bacterium]